MKRNSNIYSHSFGGIIWNIEFDEVSNALLIEIRSTVEQSFELHRTSLKTLETKKIVNTNLEWAHKPVCFTNDHIVLSKFTSDTSPELSGIWVLNPEGNNLWENPEFKWDSDSQNIKDPSGASRDLISGNISSDVSFQPGQLNVKNPIGYDVESEHYEEMKEFIGSEGLEGPIEYLQLDNNSFILSYNTTSEESSKCQLQVWDTSKGVIYEKKISSNQNGIAFETFFVIDNLLIYTVEKSTLEVFKL